MSRARIRELDDLLGGPGSCERRLFRLTFVHPNCSCALLWRGKVLGTYAKFFVKDRGLFGYDAREILWCLTYGRDSLPEGLWLYRLCDRPRCMDIAHLFAGPAGLSRTLGKMREVGFPAELFVINGAWEPDLHMLREWKRWVRREATRAHRSRQVQAPAVRGLYGRR